MKSFFDFLIEGKRNLEFNLNDAKGKAFEILAGSHLKHGSGKDGHPAGYLSHYRDENENSPQEVLNYIKNELDKRHPGMYNEINEHAKGAAEHMRNQLKANGHHTLKDIAWTSQPSDHKSFTGEEDPNSDADVMVHTNKGPIGLSLKYGTQKQPNLRNPGLASIEDLAGLKKGEITSLYNQHNENLKGLGFNQTADKNHAAYKADKNSEASKSAEQSSLDARRAIAKKWQDGYSAMKSDQLKQKIISLVSPETKFEHYRIHSRPTSTGVVHHMGGIQDEVNDMLNHYAEFKAVPHSGEGISAQILGRHHGSEDWHPVISHAVKNTSGPMKGMAGTTKLGLRAPSNKTPKVKKTEPTVKPAPAAPEPESKHPIVAASTHGGKQFYSPSEQEHILGLA